MPTKTKYAIKKLSNPIQLDKKFIKELYFNLDVMRSFFTRLKAEPALVREELANLKIENTLCYLEDVTSDTIIQNFDVVKNLFQAVCSVIEEKIAARIANIKQSKDPKSNDFKELLNDCKGQIELSRNTLSLLVNFFNVEILPDLEQSSIYQELLASKTNFFLEMLELTLKEENELKVFVNMFIENSSYFNNCNDLNIYANDTHKAQIIEDFCGFFEAKINYILNIKENLNKIIPILNEKAKDIFVDGQIAFHYQSGLENEKISYSEQYLQSSESSPFELEDVIYGEINEKVLFINNKLNKSILKKLQITYSHFMRTKFHFINILKNHDVTHKLEAGPTTNCQQIMVEGNISKFINDINKILEIIYIIKNIDILSTKKNANNYSVYDLIKIKNNNTAKKNPKVGILDLFLETKIPVADKIHEIQVLKKTNKEPDTLDLQNRENKVDKNEYINFFHSYQKIIPANQKTMPQLNISQIKKFFLIFLIMEYIADAIHQKKINNEKKLAIWVKYFSEIFYYIPSDRHENFSILVTMLTDDLFCKIGSSISQDDPKNLLNYLQNEMFFTSANALSFLFSGNCLKQAFKTDGFKNADSFYRGFSSLLSSINHSTAIYFGLNLQKISALVDIHIGMLHLYCSKDHKLSEEEKIIFHEIDKLFINFIENKDQMIKNIVRACHNNNSAAKETVPYQQLYLQLKNIYNICLEWCNRNKNFKIPSDLGTVILPFKLTAANNQPSLLLIDSLRSCFIKICKLHGKQELLDVNRKLNISAFSFAKFSSVTEVDFLNNLPFSSSKETDNLEIATAKKSEGNKKTNIVKKTKNKKTKNASSHVSTNIILLNKNEKKEKPQDIVKRTPVSSIDKKSKSVVSLDKNKSNNNNNNKKTLPDNEKPRTPNILKKENVIEKSKDVSFLQKTQDGVKKILGGIFNKKSENSEQKKKQEPKSVKFLTKPEPFSESKLKVSDKDSLPQTANKGLNRSTSMYKIKKEDSLIKKVLIKSASNVNLKKISKSNKSSEKINTDINNGNQNEGSGKIELKFGDVTILRSNSMVSLNKVEEKNLNNQSENIINNESNILIFSENSDNQELDKKHSSINTLTPMRRLYRSISSYNLPPQASFFQHPSPTYFLRYYFDLRDSKNYLFKCYYRYKTVCRPGYAFGVDKVIPVQIPYYYFQLIVDNVLDGENEYSIRFVAKEKNILRINEFDWFSRVTKNRFLADNFDAFLVKTLEPTVLLYEYSVPMEMRRFCFNDYQKNDILPEFIHSGNRLEKELKFTP